MYDIQFFLEENTFRLHYKHRTITAFLGYIRRLFLEISEVHRTVGDLKSLHNAFRLYLRL